MRIGRGIWMWCAIFLSVCFALTSNAIAYDISGTVTNSTGKKGRVYLNVQSSGGGSMGLGVSIPDGGPYTIRGVPSGSYSVQAFMDTQTPEAGIRHASDPVGQSGPVTVGTASVNTGADITLGNPGVVSAPPQSVHAMSGNGSAFIEWDVPRDQYGAEIGRFYTVYWSSTPNPGPANFTGKAADLPSGRNSGYLVRGLTNGATYYFSVTARAEAGWEESAPTGISPDPFIIAGGRSGGYTVSGTLDSTGITKNGGNGTPLWVAAAYPEKGPAAFAYIANPADQQPFSITGLPAGDYQLYAILDMNNNGLIDAGDYMTSDSTARPVSVVGADLNGADFVLTSQPAEVRVGTSHWMDSKGQGYSLNFDASGRYRLPVNVSVSGPQLPGTVDMAADQEGGGRFHAWTSVPNRPQISPADSYNFTIAYADGTSTGNQPLTAQVNGVVDAVATPMTPFGVITGGAPSFSWSAPSPAPAGPYSYNVSLDGNGTHWESPQLPSSQLSAAYGFDGGAPPLLPGTPYNWRISVRDAQGNSASGNGLSFTVASVTGSAAGSYSFDATSRLLTLNWASSDFVCAGPQPGTQETKSVSTLNATTLSWLDGADAMTFSRNGSTGGTDLVGTWTGSEAGTGNSYSVSFAPDGGVTVQGTIQQCGGSPSPAQMSITGFAPQSGAAGTPVTINGSNFDPNPANNAVEFNGTPANVTFASSNQLTVVVPQGATSGPITVWSAGMSAGTASPFTIVNAPISFSGTVKSSAGVGLSGISVQLVENPAMGTITAGNGGFSIAGIPGGQPFTLRASSAGLVDAYIGPFTSTTDISGKVITVYTVTEAANLGLGAGKGAIVGQAAAGGAPLAEASILVVSPAKAYSVLYEDATGTPGPGNATSASGRFYILNLNDGETLVLTAAHPLWSFAQKAFTPHADGVTEGMLPALSIPFASKAQDSAGQPVAGARAEVAGYPAVSALSGADGAFTLYGAPAGTPFSVKLSKDGFFPVYSSLFSSNSGITTSSPYAFYTPTEVAGFGVQAGKGVIKSRVVDSASANGYLADCVVTAQSALHPETPYQVTYYDGGSYGGNATYANGIYLVLNVDEGDTVTVQASKQGWSFSPRIFPTHADAVSEGRLQGISSAPPAGGSIAASPMALNFPDAVGSYAPQTVTLSNNGTGSLTVQSAGVNGDPSFSVQPGGPNPCPALPHSFAPGEACTLQANFNATGTGSRFASLVVSSDAVNAPTLSIGLNGYVTPQWGSISGRVTDQTGAGLPAVSVQVYDALSGFYQFGAGTDDAGNYLLSGLPSGAYKVQFTYYSRPTGTTSGTTTGGTYYPTAPLTLWYDGASSIDTATTVNVTAPDTTPGVNAVLDLSSIPAPPQISGASPPSAQVGASVSIYGSGFGAPAATSLVFFNGTLATVTNWSNGQIDAIVPAGATSGPISVSTQNMTVWSNFAFNVQGPPPQVVRTLPGRDATGIPVKGGVFVSFDRQMDSGSINAGSFTLQSASGSSVPAAVQQHDYSYALVPAAPLEPNTVYTATLSTGVRSFDGGSLAEPFSWSFSTGSATASSFSLQSGIFDLRTSHGYGVPNYLYDSIRVDSDGAHLIDTWYGYQSATGQWSPLAATPVKDQYYALTDNGWQLISDGPSAGTVALGSDGSFTWTNLGDGSSQLMEPVQYDLAGQPLAAFVDPADLPAPPNGTYPDGALAFFFRSTALNDSYRVYQWNKDPGTPDQNVVRYSDAAYQQHTAAALAELPVHFGFDQQLNYLYLGNVAAQLGQDGTVRLFQQGPQGPTPLQGSGTWEYLSVKNQQLLIVHLPPQYRGGQQGETFFAAVNDVVKQGEWRQTGVQELDGEPNFNQTAFDWMISGGTPTGGTPALSANPQALDFGNVNAGTSSETRMVTFSNSGSADLVVQSADTVGPDAALFQVAPAGANPCPQLPATFLPGQSCTVGVTFNPTGSGVRQAAISLTSNGGSTPLSVPLTGNGVVFVPGSQTIVPGPMPTLIYGGTALVTANGGPSGNPVTFTSATPAVCSTGGQNGATLSALAVGTCSIVAHQAGNAAYAPANDLTLDIPVGKAGQKIGALSFSSTQLSFGGSVTVSATGGPSGNPVSFKSLTPQVCSVTNNSVLALAVGTCTVAADQAGDANYQPAPQARESLNVAAVVPGAPSVVGVSAGNGQATVSFSAPLSSGGSPVTGYVVFSNPAGGFDPFAGKPGLIRTVTGLTNGVAYTFTVVASNFAGSGPASEPSASVVPASNPEAPTGLVAQPGDASATVSFLAPKSDGGSPVTGYAVVATPGGISVKGDKSPISVSGLNNGTVYSFTVTASNARGASAPSAPSNPVKPATVPSPPSAVAASANNGSATVSFTGSSVDGGSPITGYTVISNPAGGTDANAGTLATVHTITGLANGTSYSFTVVARNERGTSQPSGPSAAVTPSADVPAPPSAVRASAADARASVSFTPPSFNGGSELTGYTVISNPPGGVDGSAGTLATQHEITGLKNGTAYSFTVVAQNATGSSVPSAPSNQVVPATVPGAPMNVNATVGDAHATVSFAPPASNGGSDITVYTVVSSPENISVSGTASPILVGGLSNGTVYRFSVAATNAKGTGPSSAPSKEVTPDLVPGAPTGVNAAAGNGSAEVSFVPPAANGGSPVTSYIVTSYPGNLSVNGTASPITVAGLVNGSAYSFTVTAVNAKGAGPASALSNSTIPDVVPGAPTGVSASHGNASSTVSFTPPAPNGGTAILRYTVTAQPGNLSFTGFGSPIAVTGLTNGITYSFTVSAANAKGTGPASAASDPITPTADVPGAPLVRNVAAGNASAIVNFSAPASNGGSTITGYTVFSNPAGGIDSNAGSTETSHLVTGLTNGVPYSFTVVASNTAGNGAASPSSASVVPMTLPGAPTGVAAVAEHALAKVSFSAPAENGGSPITRYTVTVTPGGQTVSGQGSPIVVTGLTDGTSYSFTVSATTLAGTGPASSPSGAVTPADTVAPTVRSFGVPGSVAALDTATSTSIPVTGLYATDNAGVTGYLVATTPDRPAAEDSRWSLTPPASVEIGSAPGEHSVYAFAKDAAGNVSTPFAASVVVTPIDTTAPVIISGPIVTSLSNTTAVIEWVTNEAATGGVKYGDSFPLVTGVSETGYRTSHALTVTGLAADTTYFVSVWAVDHSGNGPALSKEISLRTKPAPDTAAPYIIEGPAVSAIGADTALVQWRTNEPAQGTLSFGTSNTLGSSLAESGFSTVHSLKLTGLTPETPYFLKVSAVDLAGNGPRESTMASFRTVALPDTTAPVFVEGPMVVNISDTGATVLWKTDEPSTSTVISFDGANYGFSSDSGLSTSHSVTLTGLTALTPYSYKVSSTDAAGNVRTLENFKTFSTRAAPDTVAPVIIDGPLVLDVGWQSAAIRWGTDEPADSVVEYGTSESFGASTSLSALARTHTATLTGLEAGTVYYYRVLSTDAFGNGPTASRVYSFITEQDPSFKVPVITHAPEVIYKTDTSMTVYWETDDPCDSVVEYGEDNTLTQRVSNPEKVNKHQITITNLKKDTAYKVVVSSTNLSGNTVYAKAGVTARFLAFAADLVFSDAAPVSLGNVITESQADVTAPVLGNTPPSAVAVTDKQATITWTTDEISDSQVSYGPTGGALGLSAGDPTQVTTHAVVLTNLEPSTTYDFQVASTDPSGNGPTVSTTLSFTTAAAPDTVAPAFIGTVPLVISFQDATGKTIIGWTTDEPATTQIRFGTSSDALNNQAALPGLSPGHSLTLALQPGTTYYAAAVAMDGSGNLSQSATLQFTTLGVLDATEPTTSLTPGAGSYLGPQSVTLTADEPATIYYTVDGSAPTTGSSQYNGPIQVTTSKTLKYFAVDAAGNKEVVKTAALTIQFAISASASDANGNISCPAAVNAGETGVCTLAPNTGYTVASASGCGGTLAGTSFTTAALAADCSITASFTPIVLSVAPSATGGGTIAPATPQAVNYGSSTTFTVTPATGFQVESVTGCGGTLSGTSYTTAALTAGCSVSATFVPITYSVTPALSGSGEMVPAVPQTVNYGASTSFSVTPAAGFRIASVTGCGGTLSGTTYSTGTITGACTVSASFTPITYSVTPAVSGSGTVSPAVTQTVNSGAATNFTVTPAEGYRIESVTGCGGALSGSTYSTGTITGACTVSATFVPITYAVTPAATGNGSLSPATVQTVNAGAGTSFTVTPATGYQIASVSGCGGSLSGSTYTVPAVSGSCTVTANFSAIPVPPLLGDLDGDGAVTIADALRALKIAVHAVEPTAWDWSHGDVGPLVDDKPAPDQHLNIADTLLILEKVVGPAFW